MSDGQVVGQAPYLGSARNGIYPRPGPALKVKLINSTKGPHVNCFLGILRAFKANTIFNALLTWLSYLLIVWSISFIPKFAIAQQVGAGQIKAGSVSPILIAASLLRRVNWSICPLNINIDVNR